MNHWRVLETDADLPLMSRVLGISETAARVMANRGIRSKKTAQAYLSPALDRLRDPLLMKDAEKALRLIVEAVARKDKIMIYGDYDCDGVTGTVILYKTLTRYGADADYYIPRRTEEGYGLNIEAVRRMREAGVDMVITVDNGIAALAEVAEANRLGMRVVVIDHHEPGFVESGGIRTDVVPDAAAVVDPKQTACSYPFKSFCAAGLAYKLMGAFCAYTGMPFTDHDELLALAAVATVCDIVELTDENRVIVRNGLDILNQNKLINPGLGSLIARRGYLDKTVDTFVAGFVLGPCINATGRLDDAAQSVALMLKDTADERGRSELAYRLTELNDERRAITADSVTRVLAALPEAPDKVLVLTDRDTHESVAGIVAGRVRETVNRPVILLTASSEGGFKGSGRSIEGYNLFEALYRHRELLTRFGGHAMAAGLSLCEDNIDELRTRLNRDCTLTEEDFHAVIAVDGILKADGVTLALSEELTRLAPFGRGNKEPLFVTYDLTPESFRAIDDKNTLLFTFLTDSGRRIKGICFGMNEYFAQTLSACCDSGEYAAVRQSGRAAGLVVDAVYGVETNIYNGNVTVQMRIKDFVIRRHSG